MDEFLGAHISDILQKCEKGIAGSTGFLDPREQYEAQKYIRHTGILPEVKLGEDGVILPNSSDVGMLYSDGGYVMWGGYSGAERKRLFTLPAYLFYAAVNISDLLRTAFDDDPVTALSIKGSGYAKLTHRDYLGALLNAGIKRESMGDIVAASPEGETSNFEAVAFFVPSVAKWLLEDPTALVSVGRDKIKLGNAVLSDNFGRTGSFKHIDGVIASARLDCVVALLCGISREKAKAEITSCAVRLNYEELVHTDREINEGDILSVKGFGRFRIESFDGRTKKDRLRISAVKYI